MKKLPVLCLLALLGSFAAPTIAVPPSKGDTAPAQSKPAAFTGGTFKMICNASTSDLPIVQLRINDSEPLYFIVDTGFNSGMILEPWALRKLKLPSVPIDDGYDWSSGGAARIGQVKAEKIAFVSPSGNSVPVSFGHVLSLDIPIFGYNGIYQVAGVIGMEFLADKKLVINPDDQTVSFLPSPAILPPSIGTKVSLNEKSTRQFFVTGDVSGVGKVQLLLDTGASSCGLKPKLIRKASLRINTEASTSSTIRGHIKTHSVLFDQIKIGSLTEVSVRGSADATSDDDLLGMSLLKRFVVTIDFPRKEMFLKPVKNYDVVVESYGECGFNIAKKDGKLLVTRLDFNSVAAKNGVLPGDEVVVVSGQKASPDNSSIIEQVETGRVGSRITLRLRRANGEEYSADAEYADPYKPLDTPYPIGFGVSNKMSDDGKMIASMKVSAVLPKSRAELAGLREGDTIESISGLTIKGATVAAILEAKSKLSKGAFVIVVTRAGIDKPLEIRVRKGNAQTLRDLL